MLIFFLIDSIQKLFFYLNHNLVTSNRWQYHNTWRFISTCNIHPVFVSFYCVFTVGIIDFIDFTCYIKTFASYCIEFFHFSVTHRVCCQCDLLCIISSACKHSMLMIKLIYPSLFVCKIMLYTALAAASSLNEKL